MAFTVRFPTSGPCPPAQQVAAWLTAHGEPFELHDGGDSLSLRALPMRFVAAGDAETLQAHLEVTAIVPLTRVVDLLFGISVEAGADVNLAGEGEISRAALWMRLADEQDRSEILETLERAKYHANTEEILSRLWAIVSALRPNRDDRWDVVSQRIVEMLEVDAPDGIDADTASWHAEDPKAGDVVAVPLDNSHHIHSLAWRWLSEAYPGLAEPHTTAF